MKNRMLPKLLLIIVSSTFAVFFFFTLVRGKAGDWIVAFLEDAFSLYPRDALMIYQSIIRNNIDFIILFTIIFLAVIISAIFIWRVRVQRISIEKEAEKRRNELVTYLAHDIKTPLASVIGYLSLLDENPDMPHEQKAKYLSITLEKANRLAKLVDEFFEITRYDFQAGSLSKESIDLYYMLTQMTDEFYPLLTAKGNQAIINVSEDMTIYGDPDKLARVFNNILKNAVAYSPANSVIVITATVLGDMISVVFTNAGNIPKDKLASIFEKFYRLDSARSSDTGNAGLGLAIAKEIIISHGGRIYANSNGEQTSFTIELPALPKQS